MLNHWWVQPSDIPWEEGIMRWASQRGNKFEAPGWWRAAQCGQARGDPTLQLRCTHTHTTAAAILARSGGAMWTSTSTTRSVPLARSLDSSLSTPWLSPDTHPSFATLTGLRRSCPWTGVSCRRAYTAEAKHMHGQSSKAQIRKNKDYGA